jgi:hypothetical protein
MPCNHRFLNLHREDEFALFPDWEIDYLIIGTFNPKWDNPNNNNADYFYGRSRYFWKVISIFFRGVEFVPETMKAKVEFCRKYRIGFTDLFENIITAKEESDIDKNRIFSFKDTDLESFGLSNISKNTQKIKEYLRDRKSMKVLFTLLSGNSSSIISKEITEIEAYAKQLKIETARLHSPTGQGLGGGKPRINKLIEKWNSHNLLPVLDLSLYPYK